MSYQLNLWNEQLCLNVDTANSADATYPPPTTTESGATSAYNATPSLDHATNVEEKSIYLTTDTAPWSQPSLDDLSTMTNPYRVNL